MNQMIIKAIPAANHDPHTIKFFDEDDKQIGQLALERGELRFTGSADAAARAFLGLVCMTFNAQMDALKQGNAELLGALKRLCNLPSNCPCEIGDDELNAYDNALYVIAKEEQRIK